ncbi:hypothetical protein RJ641_007482 [Dillenia turbinata]|uniref:Uncharacterized protein n=1 Tax=Dillenia turbinata TaxID=194707 RepID=A0AAN8UZB9_9MAGN
MQTCSLTGEIPHWVSMQKTLDFLDLSKSNLKGTFLEWLVEMQVSGIILSDNKLTGIISGELPENIGDANEMMILMLAGNNFSGQIPKSIANIYRLLLLDLSKNRFTATGNSFPVFDPNGFLAYLEHSDLHDNKIPSELPDVLSQISTLQILDFRNNSLQVDWKRSRQGLPSHSHGIYSIGGLESVERLDLSKNKLSGSIPQTLAKLQEFSTLDLSNNELVGLIPVGGQRNTMNDPNNFANNSGLCGVQIRATSKQLHFFFVPTKKGEEFKAYPVDVGGHNEAQLERAVRGSTASIASAVVVETSVEGIWTKRAGADGTCKARGAEARGSGMMRADEGLTVKGGVENVGRDGEGNMEMQRACERLWKGHPQS